MYLEIIILNGDYPNGDLTSCRLTDLRRLSLFLIKLEKYSSFV